MGTRTLEPQGESGLESTLSPPAAAPRQDANRGKETGDSGHPRRTGAVEQPGSRKAAQTRRDEWMWEKKRREAVKAESRFFGRNRRFLWSTIEPTPKRRQELDVRY